MRHDMPLRTAPDRFGMAAGPAPHGSLVFMVPGIGAAAAQPEGRVATPCALPARLDAWVRIDPVRDGGCAASLGAALVLPGLQARVTLRRRPDGAGVPEAECVRVPMVVPGEQVTRWGDPVTIPRRCALAVEVVDGTGRPLAAARPLGAGTPGCRDAALSFLVEAIAVARVAGADGCARRAPRVRFSGELLLTGGVSVRLVWHPVNGNGGGAGVIALPLVAPGFRLHARERALEGCGAGSTWVAVRFADTAGRPVGDEHVVGRCVVV